MGDVELAEDAEGTPSGLLLDSTRANPANTSAAVRCAFASGGRSWSPNCEKASSEARSGTAGTEALRVSGVAAFAVPAADDDDAAPAVLVRKLRYDEVERVRATAPAAAFGALTLLPAPRAVV